LIKVVSGLVSLSVLVWFYFGLSASIWFAAAFVFGHLYTMAMVRSSMLKVIQQNEMLRVTPWNNMRCRCGAQLTDEDGKLKAWRQKP